MAACRHRQRHWVVAMLLLALAGGSSGTAHAGLGQPAESLLRDHAALGGTAFTRTIAVGFDVLESTTAGGFSVRQYLSPQGIVFGAAWDGPALPDLKVILGDYYGRYSADLHTRAANAKLHRMRTGDLVLQVAKLPRGFAGSAYVPALLPPGVGIEAIR